MRRCRLLSLLLALLPLPAFADAVRVTAALEPAEVPVQAQATYVLRFWQAVAAERVDWTPPAPRLAELRPLDGGRVYEASHAGQRYRVQEKRWAVLPHASGELLLDGAAVEALLPTLGQRRRLVAPDLTLRVTPAAATPWLPARGLTLTDSWTGDEPSAVAGAPLTRRLRVEALGVAAAQIPDPWPLAGDGVRRHAHPPRLRDSQRDGLLVAVREQDYDIQVMAAGEHLLLPARIDWWDVTGGGPRASVLPPRRLRATAALPGAAVAPAASAPQAKVSQFWRWSPLALAALPLWLWWRRPAFALTRRLRRAPDAAAARDIVFAWARGRGLIATSLPALAAALGEPAAAELAHLDRALYGGGGDWSATRLADALAVVRNRQARPGGKRKGRLCR